MTVGGSSYGEMSDASQEMAPIFFVVFMLLFFVVLLNMFISIIGVNYEETVDIIASDEKGHTPPGAVDMIKNEVQRAFDEIAVTMTDDLEKAESSSDDKALDTFRANVANKLPLLYRIFSKVLGMRFIVRVKAPEAEKRGQTPGRSPTEPRHTEELKESETDELRRNSDGNARAQNDRGELVTPILGSFLRSGLTGRRVDSMEEIVKNEQTLGEIEKDQVSMWMSMLEKMLRTKSESELSITDLVKRSYKNETRIEFYPTKSIEDLKPRTREFVFAPSRSRVQRELWNKAKMPRKYEFWCGLDTVYSEYYDIENSHAGTTPLPPASMAPSPEKESVPVAAAAVEAAVAATSNSPPTANPVATIVAAAMGANVTPNPDVSGPGHEEKVDAIFENLNIVEEEEKKGSESVSKSEVEESSIEVTTTQPLAPKLGNVTLKGMFFSPEYNSMYSRIASPLQWDYWNSMLTAQKAEFWLFYLTGKQRVRLWSRMRFSRAGIQDYMTRVFPESELLQSPDLTLELIWKSMVRGKGGRQNALRPFSDLDESAGNAKFKLGLLNRILVISMGPADRPDVLKGTETAGPTAHGICGSVAHVPAEEGRGNAGPDRRGIEKAEAGQEGAADGLLSAVVHHKIEEDRRGAVHGIYGGIAAGRGHKGGSEVLRRPPWYGPH